MIRLVTSLLANKPHDPIPHIYSYLQEVQKNIDPEHIVPITDNELNEIKNLQKKIDYYQEALNHNNNTEDNTSDSNQSEEEEIQPKKKNIKKQRAGVSAEVYGTFNKKGNFQPKVIPKSNETKQKLSQRLLQAFMFTALDEKDFNIVVDAIEEVKGVAKDVIIKEGDQGDCMYVLESGMLDCTKTFAGNKDPTHLKVYQPGEGFGELALLYNAPRAATITAKTDYVIYRLDRDTFNHIVKDASSKKREKYDNFL